MQCKICGYTSDSIEDFEEMADGSGVWCPMCDGFTSYHNKLELVSLDVCLEKKGAEKKTETDMRISLPERTSPLRYPGGKGKMLKLLEPYFPEYAQTVIEPFAGGASVSLAMLLSGRAEHIVINDMDDGVSAFWNEALWNTDDFLERLTYVQGTREEFLIAKQCLECPKQHKQAELAVAFTIANQLAFSGITKAGIAGDYEKRWNYKKLEDRIQKIAEYRNQIAICKKDALEIVEEYYWDSNNFLFIDPPYIQQGKALYRKWYEEADHKRLAELIRELTSSYPGCAKILITYDQCTETEMLYQIPYARQHTISRRYSCGCAK